MSIFTITGATGSVGKAIVNELLTQGHQVRVLSTRKDYKWEGIEVFHWNPKENSIDDGALEGADHLIHLAGATVSKRWTAAYKREINDSRVYTSKVLLDSLNRVSNGPSSCVSASAIGYYGTSLTELFTEDCSAATDFLASVTENWERYTQLFASPTRRSVQLRIGIVLDKGAGVLGQLVPLAKAGIGRDIYTHVTYADLRTIEEKGKEEWKNEFDLELSQGESHFLYGKYQVQLDTMVVEAPGRSEGEFDYVVLGAGLQITTMDDSVYKVMPIYAVQGDEANHVDAEIKELGLKFRFERINYETNKPVITASEHTEAEEPFILIKAEVFPWINLLWLGSILMAIGTVIAMVTRIRRL